MNGLSAFLPQNAIKAENQKHVVSARFLDKDNKPMIWETRIIASSEYEAIKSSCMKRIPVPGKKGMYTSDLDTEKLFSQLVAKCTVFPDLNNAELQDAYGVMGAEKLARTMLLPGEFDEYVGRIQEWHGFSTDFDELVDDAKN